jgi:hypothetical protein
MRPPRPDPRGRLPLTVAAIPYSNHGVEPETRLELATLTLARYGFDRRRPRWTSPNVAV